MISSHGRWVGVRTRLRMHSQGASFWVGLGLALVSAWLWYRTVIGPIMGSLLVGVGAAVIAAAIVAYLSPFNEAAFRRFLSLGIADVQSSRQAINDPYWVDHLHGAREKCTLLGIANGKWCTDERFHPTLHERLKHGVTFKMLFLDPESEAAKLRESEEKRGDQKRQTRDAIRGSIKIMWEFREKLDAGLKEQLRLYVYNATPSCGLMWIDRYMLVTHYLSGLPDVTSPALVVTPPQVGMQGSLYNTYAENVEKMQNNSTEIDDRNIERFLPQEPPKKQGGKDMAQSSSIQASGTGE